MIRTLSQLTLSVPAQSTQRSAVVASLPRISAYAPRAASYLLAAFCTFTSLPVLSTITGNLAPAVADSGGPYRWTDQGGKLHFGSHPPKDALNVVSLSGRKFSHYSSSKLIRPYRSRLTADSMPSGSEFDGRISSKGKNQKGRIEINPGSLAGNDPSPRDTTRDTSARASLKRRGIHEETLVSGGSTEDSSVAPELIQGPVSIKFDEHKRITDCRVGVQNNSNIPAQGVIVSFEFSDGTLIPGVGPASLSSGEEGTYLVPDELLPIVIKNLENDSNPTKPQVTIKAGD